jgi:hypothetical protein
MALQVRFPEASMVVAQVLAPQSVGLAAKLPAVPETLPVTLPVKGPLKPVEVKIPVDGLNDNLVDETYWERFPVLAVTQVGYMVALVVVSSVIVVVVAAVARSIVMLFGTSASAIAAQVRLPEAAIAVAKLLAKQSEGSAASAVAVPALPEISVMVQVLSAERS